MPDAEVSVEEMLTAALKKAGDFESKYQFHAHTYWAPVARAILADEELMEAIRGEGDSGEGWERSRWLRILDNEGRTWLETSSPREIRTEVEEHPDWPVYRIYERTTVDTELRPVTPEQLAEDCAAEDEWYRKALGR